jgi:hypothetical protein
MKDITRTRETGLHLLLLTFIFLGLLSASDPAPIYAQPTTP